MPKSKYKINKKGRVCVQCKKFKFWKEFSLYKKGAMAHNAKCKICNSIYMKEYLLYYKRKPAGIDNNISKPSKNATKDINLKFLVSLGQLSKKSWTYPQVVHLLNGLNTETIKGNYDFNAIYKKYAPHKTLWSCHSMRIELTKAAQARMSLKKYWNNGRPFSPVAIKNRIIVPGQS